MDEKEFRAAIAKAGISKREIAAQLGVSEQAFYNKMNGKAEFKNSEILKLAEMLNLSMNEVNLIFFRGCVN